MLRNNYTFCVESLFTKLAINPRPIYPFTDLIIHTIDNSLNKARDFCELV